MTFSGNARKIYSYDLLGRSQVHYVFTHQKPTSNSSLESDIDGTGRSQHEIIKKNMSGSQERYSMADSVDAFHSSMSAQNSEGITLDSNTRGSVDVPAEKGPRVSLSEPSQPFLWASPLHERQKSCLIGTNEVEKIVAEFGSEGTPFSREVFLKTGRLDHDVYEPHKEREGVTEGTSSGRAAEDVALGDQSQDENLQHSVRHMPEGTASLLHSHSSLQPDSSLLPQSNLSVGELSAEEYSVGSINLSVQTSLASPSASQVVRPETSGLVLNSASSEMEKTPEYESEDQRVATVSGEYQTSPSSKPGSGAFLDDSFTSEVSEAEEKVLADPPLALLMFSQPKVWTDEAGEPTKDDEDAVSINTDGGENQDERQESSAGLWMEDNMLQTIVPKEKPSTDRDVDEKPPPPPALPPQNSSGSGMNIEDVNAGNEADLSSGERATRSQENVSVSYSEGSKLCNMSENLSQTNPTQSPSIQHEKNKYQSRIPQTVRSTSSGDKRSRSSSKKDEGKEVQHRKSNTDTSQSHKLQSGKASSQNNQPDKPLRKTGTKTGGSKQHLSTSKEVSPNESLERTGMEAVKSDVSMSSDCGPKSSKERTLSAGKPHSSTKSVEQVVSKPSSVGREKRNKELLADNKWLVSPGSKEQGVRQEGEREYETDIALSEHKDDLSPPPKPVRAQQQQALYEESGYVPQTSSQIKAQQAKLAKLKQTRMELLEQEQLDMSKVSRQSASRDEQQSQGVHVFTTAPSDLSTGKMKSPAQTVDELLTDVGIDVYGMEEVRGRLQNVFKPLTHTLPEKSFDHNSHIQSLLSSFQEETSQVTASSYPGYGPKSLGELTSQIDSLSSYGGADAARSTPRSDATLGLENQLLRENLEKEIYRRKHCEKQIHLLQSKLLEVQQQLAVGVNSDRKKDTMIEQLDKALAKVVEGWRIREAEKMAVIKDLQTENQKLASRSDAQQQLLKKFESETATVVDQLTAAQKTVEMAEQDRDYQMAVKERERLEAVEAMEMAQEKYKTVNADHEDLLHQAEKIRNQLIKIQGTLEHERDCWEEKEREYLQKIDEITENHLTSLEQEKVQFEQQAQLLQETRHVLAGAQSEVQNLSQQLDTATREKDSLHVQLGLLEDKMESSLRKLEADLRCEAEKELSSKLDEAHRRQRASEEELHERLRRQVHELSERHTVELKEVHRQHQDDLRHKDEAFTERAIEFEETIKEGREELKSLHDYAKQLESQRQDMTSRLQMMMQSHWEEAVNLLMGAPSGGNKAALMRQLSGYRMDVGWQDGQQMSLPPSSQSYRAQKLLNNLPEDLKKLERQGSGEERCEEEDNNPEENLAHNDVPPNTTIIERQYPSPPSQDLHPQHNTGQQSISLTNPIFFNQHQERSHVPSTQPQSETEGQNQAETHHLPQPPPFNTGPSHIHHPHQPIPSNNGHSHHPQLPTTFSNAPSQSHHPHLPTPFNNSQSHGSHPHQPPLFNNSQSHGYHQPTPFNTDQSHLPGYQVKETAEDVSSSLPPATLGQPVVTRLEPSFLQTLANEPHHFTDYHPSQNSSMMSMDGCAPLPLDTSVSTINDDVGFHNVTGLSVGPLGDTELPSTSSSSILPQLSYPATDKGAELNYSGMAERFQQHAERQKELERYMKMLLNRSPGHPISSSEAVQAQQQEDGADPPPGGLSPGQIGEISRLLGMYRSRAASNFSSQQQEPPTDENSSYLHDHTNSSFPNPNGARATQLQHEQPTRQPAAPGGAEAKTQVIKVPTGAEGNSPKGNKSPPRSSSTNKPTHRPAPRHSHTLNKDSKQRPKAKVWK